jgi:hypothetical protein
MLSKNPLLKIIPEYYMFASILERSIIRDNYNLFNFSGFRNVEFCDVVETSRRITCHFNTSLVFYSSSANKRTKELVCGRLQAGGVGVLSKAGILRHFGKLPGLKSTRVALQFSGNQRAYY